MKKLLMLTGLVVLLASCGSTVFNDAKKQIADKASETLVKELKEEYVKPEYAGLECMAEADALGSKFKGELYDFLKVKEEADEAQAMKKSAVKDSLKLLCTAFSTSVLPMYLRNSGESYKCLRMLGATKTGELGSKLCDKI